MSVRRARGFTLIEVIVAVALFATVAVLAWGGLDAVLRARANLAAQQDDFARTLRAVGLLERDLRSAAARPVRGNYSETLPAFVGDESHVEFTRQGYANPLAEPRANLERVAYTLDGKTLHRARWAVLDRAAGTRPQLADLRGDVTTLRLRYLDASGRSVDRWPPDRDSPPEALPRAVEFRFDVQGLGEIRRLVEVPAGLPPKITAARP